AAVGYWAIRWEKYDSMNLEDRRILSPIKLLEGLQTDILPKDPMKLMVSFEGYKKHGQKLGGSRGGKNKEDDTWLQAEGFLAEKTRFRVVVSQRISASEKRKRKYTKRKEKVSETIGIYLRPSAKVYKGLERFSSQFGPGESVAGMKIESARNT